LAAAFIESDIHILLPEVIGKRVIAVETFKKDGKRYEYGEKAEEAT
jgi:hypothetical protein